jgi:alpha-ribazole phosphatase
MSETLIDFIRHGEPEGGRRFRGNGADDPLSEKGWRQMWDAVGDNRPWQRIISSPLKRCADFASALSDRHALPLTLDGRFREVCMGSWEGRSRAEIIAANEDQYRAFYADPEHNRPPDFEPLAGFSERVGSALSDALRTHAGEHVLVVAHAGVIRAVLGYTLQAAPGAWYRARVDNAGFTRLASDSLGLHLEFHNRPALPVA